MPRLRNRTTGVVVSVANEKVSRFDADWEPADKPEPKQAEKQSPRKAEPKSSK